MDRIFFKEDKIDGRLEQRERTADALHRQDFWGVEEARKVKEVHKLFTQAANELSDAAHHRKR